MIGMVLIEPRLAETMRRRGRRGKGGKKGRERERRGLVLTSFDGMEWPLIALQ